MINEIPYRFATANYMLKFKKRACEIAFFGLIQHHKDFFKERKKFKALE